MRCCVTKGSYYSISAAAIERTIEPTVAWSQSLCRMVVETPAIPLTSAACWRF